MTGLLPLFGDLYGDENSDFIVFFFVELRDFLIGEVLWVLKSDLRVGLPAWNLYSKYGFTGSFFMMVISLELESSEAS